MVRLRGLVKSFGSTKAVDGLDLYIEAGESVALLGPNGAGKSTTISMLLGLLQPDHGHAEVLGQQPQEAVAGGGVGVMLQEAGLMPGVRVGELLAFVRSLYREPLAMRELVETAGLEEVINRRADRLSGGQSQRVRFAMAIAGDPAVVVLDEPTAAMDVQARRAFWERMRTLAEAGKTILFATHYLEEADTAADRIVVIARGRRVADGSAAEIKAAMGERRVRFTLVLEQKEEEKEGETEREEDRLLRTIEGVSRLERYGQRITLYTRDSDATVKGLASSNLRWKDLEIEGANLEEAFLTLTKEGTAGGGGEREVGGGGKR